MSRVLEDVCVDPGVLDKRVLVIQSEFYGALAAMKRQGNTLSAVMRDAWDKGDLRTIVKNSPAKATDAHLSIIANITRDELLRGMLVDDFDAWEKYLTDNKVNFAPRRTRPDGALQLYVIDPDGHYVELCTSPPSK